ncbi:ROK family protein [Echinicola jeungdonensis]|uniref:ROK family protein n=1 Tax=Echinicola jeungdonensis TaxID=709343 RepID=A0ABV5J331_9BACT|nr:ROK family protein [Echinicola jeungdonensis]MDN3667853.1 ROK family protein [Echinicola jeungdonensis]
MDEKKVIGVDIGGSHITAGVVNLATHSMEENTIVRKKVDSKGGKELILDAWTNCIREVQKKSDPNFQIGIAMPGPFDYAGGISWIIDQGKFKELYGVNVKSLLAKSLGISEGQIRFENDAACFLQGEVCCGVGIGVKKAIGLTLGTGLGSSRYSGGFAKDAALWSSPFRGKILEDYISTRWFTQNYKERTGKSIKGVKEIIEDNENQGVVKDLGREFGQSLAEFLEKIISKDHPEIILLGGNICKAAHIFLPFLEEKLNQKGISVPVKISELGEKAALMGAAHCWAF